MDTRGLLVLGLVLIGAAIVTEITNVPVALPAFGVALLVGLGGLCLAVFLVIVEFERWDGTGPDGP